MSAIIKHNGFYYPGLFESVFGKNALNHYTAPGFNGNVPAVNISENKEGFRIELAAPGLKKEDFKLNLERNQLTISSQKTHTEENKEEKYSLKEFHFKSFQRTFTLPEAVDAEKISAAYEDGVLVVALPKKTEAQSPLVREIEIG